MTRPGAGPLPRPAPRPQGGTAKEVGRSAATPGPAAGVLRGPRRPTAWHVLRWNGLPPEGEVPAFSDATRRLTCCAPPAAGLAPRVGRRAAAGAAGPDRRPRSPVEAWPTQMTRQQRTGAGPRGRPGPTRRRRPRPPGHRPLGGRRRRDAGAARALCRCWPEQAREAGTAVDAERRRRREAGGRRPGPSPPPLLRRRPARRSTVRASRTRTERPRARRAARAGAGSDARATMTADGPVPFVLPGPPPARETLAGWQQWRAHPGLVRPGPAAGPGRLAGAVAAAADALRPAPRRHPRQPAVAADPDEPGRRPGCCAGGSRPTRSSTSRPPGPG